MVFLCRQTRKHTSIIQECMSAYQCGRAAASDAPFSSSPKGRREGKKERKKAGPRKIIINRKEEVGDSVPYLRVHCQCFLVATATATATALWIFVASGAEASPPPPWHPLFKLEVHNTSIWSRDCEFVTVISSKAVMQRRFAFEFHKSVVRMSSKVTCRNATVFSGIFSEEDETKRTHARQYKER